MRAVSVRNLSFGYSPFDAPIIQDISFEIEPGMRVALVGKTGSGKSTVAKLLCRFYAPWSGEIEFGGKALDKIPPGELARSVAYVDQDVFLFEGTVTGNLTLWDDEISKQQQQRALVDACLDDVIGKRGGPGSAVAEGGTNFSGGERQRLEIARALTTDPSILVLDEATASLDPVLEQQIYHNIRQRHCATLIIAHRLSAIRDCDEILVLDKGVIVQRGTHEVLSNTDGPYQKLVSWESPAHE